MAESIPNNFDNDCEMPSASHNYSSNFQPESVQDQGHPSQQPTQITKLGHDYELLETLGKGAYGVVKKAKHRQTGVIIAVKIIKKEPGEDFSKLQQEISLMESVSHSNIVAYYGSYDSNNRLSICMEFCAGGSLQKNYRDKGPLSEFQIAYVCREALKGLEYLHSQRIIHRDIKGANILLTDHGNVKLADFGVSAQLTETTSKRETMIGSSHWMAPEMTNVGENSGYNEKCDIWALGITSIELAEKEPPNWGIGSTTLFLMMSKRGFKPPSFREEERRSTIFLDFVKVSLTKNPEKRPSAETLLKHVFVTQHLSEDMGKELLSRNNIHN